MARSSRNAATRPKQPGRAASAAGSSGDPLVPARKTRPRVGDRAGAETHSDLGAAQVAQRVADALRQFRRDRQLSLDDLAARSGVSRAALSQIEAGRTNPTLAVLWKVAVGLEVPFHDLLGPSEPAAVLVLRASEAPLLRSADGRTESRLLSPGGSSKDTEVYELRLRPKATHKSEAHARGTTETVIVLNGTLRLTVGSATHELGAGDSVFFRADVEHSYQNDSSRETRFMDIIHYSR